MSNTSQHTCPCITIWLLNPHQSLLVERHSLGLSLCSWSPFLVSFTSSFFLLNAPFATANSAFFFFLCPFPFVFLSISFSVSTMFVKMRLWAYTEWSQMEGVGSGNSPRAQTVSSCFPAWMHPIYPFFEGWGGTSKNLYPTFPPCSYCWILGHSLHPTHKSLGLRKHFVYGTELCW